MKMMFCVFYHGKSPWNVQFLGEYAFTIFPTTEESINPQSAFHVGKINTRSKSDKISTQGVKTRIASLW